MSSGFGVKGTQGRCYTAWMTFSECMSKNNSIGPCAALREDYFECLHHKKQLEKLKNEQQAAQKDHTHAH
ncbi:mitochondrial Complex I CI NADH:ubiquinone oxidoreductase subunit 15-kDa NIPM/NDUFS5 [Andalucia godoyi]|uniref:NADH dehydrogenase [ubiquinone] iron-sulfur protein 5 n=1 Tax=Andalucia godoyi TaxID=505711 RepID=A0A8K0AGZ1_ANDGO|nr:mitochondrial Complex I CI NADH:ubiquinone oxidoreductase subunit 15-kDa NIPM/NDUFS5 [Andalucia godoyi]|eukprot:ANDGO_08789.mRNA.1 mitochondrial Complex I CI NADH:ubiquinone oxidoreductase subunit 15-kDa NIPM/NDUFS5